MTIDLKRVLRILSDASTTLVATAERIPDGAWTYPIADGKWSPAEIVEHLNLTFDILQRELDGGTGMAVQTKWWQRVLLRLMIVPGLLSGGAFPRNARAPREIRPRVTSARSDAMAAFREKSARLASSAEQSKDGARLTHAYFGSAPVAASVLLCARHIQHHQKQLASVG